MPGVAVACFRYAKPLGTVGPYVFGKLRAHLSRKSLYAGTFPVPLAVMIVPPLIAALVNGYVFMFAPKHKEITSGGKPVKSEQRSRINLLRAIHLSPLLDASSIRCNWFYHRRASLLTNLPSCQLLLIGRSWDICASARCRKQ